MGCCKEKKAMLPQRIAEIAEGWKNFVFKDPNVEKIAMYRASICANCLHCSKKIVWRCTLCGCPISTKARSLKSKCPDKPPRW